MVRARRRAPAAAVPASSYGARLSGSHGASVAKWRARGGGRVRRRGRPQPRPSPPSRPPPLPTPPRHGLACTWERGRDVSRGPRGGWGGGGEREGVSHPAPLLRGRRAQPPAAVVAVPAAPVVTVAAEVVAVGVAAVGVSCGSGESGGCWGRWPRAGRSGWYCGLGMRRGRATRGGRLGQGYKRAEMAAVPCAPGPPIPSTAASSCPASGSGSVPAAEELTGGGGGRRCPAAVACFR